MTACTIVGTDDMLNSFGAGLYSRAWRMTTIACHRCAFEYTIDMAGLALYQSMLTIQLKAGGQVIKGCGSAASGFHRSRLFARVLGMHGSTHQCNDNQL